jgi:hypothetical protein
MKLVTASDFEGRIVRIPMANVLYFEDLEHDDGLVTSRVVFDGEDGPETEFYCVSPENLDCEVYFLDALTGDHWEEEAP